MNNFQHQDIENYRAERPSGAVETQRPGLGNLTPTNDGSGNLIKAKVKSFEKVSQALVVRLILSPVGKHRGELIQIDGFHTKQGEEEEGEKSQRFEFG
ncbi:MAG: hypothetical protein AAFY57_18750 [Cyanobacteria bacterium J06642_2]